MDEIKSKILDIIIKTMNLDIDKSAVAGNDLIAELGINSVDALEIFVWIENEFDIQIDDDDLNSELIGSLDSIADYVAKKQAKR